MAVNQNSNKWINRFITSQVIQRGLDERTAKAYIFHQTKNTVHLLYAENREYLDTTFPIWPHRE